jgi:hypothetical protein
LVGGVGDRGEILGVAFVDVVVVVVADPLDLRETVGADAGGEIFVEDDARVVVAVDRGAGGEAVDAVFADEGEGLGGSAEVALGALEFGADFEGNG